MAMVYRHDKILPPRECILLAVEFSVAPLECTTFGIGTNREHWYQHLNIYTGCA
jgi:hypothetical protein